MYGRIAAQRGRSFTTGLRPWAFVAACVAGTLLALPASGWAIGPDGQNHSSRATAYGPISTSETYSGVNAYQNDVDVYSIRSYLPNENLVINFQDQYVGGDQDCTFWTSCSLEVGVYDAAGNEIDPVNGFYPEPGPAANLDPVTLPTPGTYYIGVLTNENNITGGLGGASIPYSFSVLPQVGLSTLPAPTLPAPTLPAPTLPAPTLPAPTLPAPRLSHQRLSATTLHGRRVEHIHFDLSSPAKVTARLERVATGRKSGGRCITNVRRPPQAARCRIVVTELQITRQMTAGNSQLTFRAPRRRWPSGSYSVNIAAVNARGTATSPLLPLTYRR
jgi:hypothetical protein